MIDPFTARAEEGVLTREGHFILGIGLGVTICLFDARDRSGCWDIMCLFYGADAREAGGRS